MPTKDVFETSFSNNPDGAGFMFLRPDGQMEGLKGFMTFDSFWKTFQTYKFGKKDLVFIHFRITSHGGTSQQNCHPFPISNQDGDLQALHWISPVAMAHNGIISGVPDAHNFSDTQIFIKLVLSDPAVLGNLESSGVNYLINSAVKGSRVAVMNCGKMYLYGQFQDVKGVLYSNTSYQEREVFTHWNPDFFEKSYYRPATSSLDDLKQEIYETLIEGSSINWIEDIVNPSDVERLRELEDAFLYRSYDSDESDYAEIFAECWEEKC